MGSFGAFFCLLVKTNSKWKNCDIEKNIDQLLHDKSFILWCLFPTEESDKQWKENYLSLYPEEAETLMLAREGLPT